MTPEVECRVCGRKLRVPAEPPAEAVPCPTCGTGVVLPRSATRMDSNVGPPGDPQTVAVETISPLWPGQPAIPPPPRPLAAVVVDSQQDPVTVPAPPQRVCPACAEPIPAAALICPWCKEDLRPDDRPWERPENPIRRDCETHRGQMIYILGLVSVIVGVPTLCGGVCLPFTLGGLVSLPLGITSWVMGQKDLEKMEQRLMDPEGFHSTESGRNLGMGGTILGGLGVLGGLLHLFVTLAGR